MLNNSTINLSNDLFSVLARALKDDRLKKTIRIKSYLLIHNAYSIKIEVLTYENNAASLRGTLRHGEQSISFVAGLPDEGICSIQLFENTFSVSMTQKQKSELIEILDGIQSWVWSNRLSARKYQELECIECEIDPETDDFLNSAIIDRFLELRDFESLKNFLEV